MCLPVDLIFEVPIGWEKLPNEIKHLLQHKMEIATIWAAKCQRRSYQRRRGLAASGSMKATLGWNQICPQLGASGWAISEVRGSASSGGSKAMLGSKAPCTRLPEMQNCRLLVQTHNWNWFIYWWLFSSIYLEPISRTSQSVSLRELSIVLL